MAAAQAPARGEIFPRRSSRGVVLGLSGPALACVLVGAVILAFAVPVLGGLGGLAVSAPVWGSLLALGLVPMGSAGGKLVDWMPIGVSFVARRATGQHEYRRPVWRTRPAGTLALAGSRARLRLWVDERDQTAFIHDPHAKTLAATCKVSHTGFMMADEVEQDSAADGFAELMASVGEASGVCRITVQHRATADGGAGIAGHWESWPDKAAAGSAARSNYEELMARSAGSIESRQSSITIVLDLEDCAREVRAVGGGLAGAAGVMRERMRLLEDHLAGAGVALRGWMTPDELAVVIRSAYDPEVAQRLQSFPAEAGGLDDAGPMAIDSGWSMLRTDTGYHRVLTVGRWPRRRVVPGFLHPVMLVPGVTCSMTLVYKPIESAQAIRDAEHDDSREAGAREDRARLGKRNTIIHRREAFQAAQHLADLDDGHADLDHAALVVVSAADRKGLDRATEVVKSELRRAKCVPRVMVAQQDVLFDAAALPLGLGMR